MAKIHNLTIKNFRGIKHFEQSFNSDFICLIGRGDSGKSTILDAISYVLSSNWNVTFFDNDFYGCDIKTPIVIEATLIDLPNEFIKEDKFGLYLRGVDKSGNITDEIEEIEEPVITIRLEVNNDLEPQWKVITKRDEDGKQISANDRSKLNTFLVSDYVDRHFTWGKGSPLYSLLKQNSESDDDNEMMDALREAKSKIDKNSFSKFDSVTSTVKDNAALFGVDISKTNTTIDFKDIVIKDGKVCLHDETIPFRLKGKGSKRLISMAIQASIANDGGIVLIDEIEQGLEPDWVQSLIHTLKQNNNGQIFISTHSRDVLVELSSSELFLMKKGARQLNLFNPNLQGLLRKNPEAFFAKRIVVAEGSTEMGICKAINDYRIINGQKSAAYLGVRVADGSGSSLVEYSKGFSSSGFSVALFCDSDDKNVNSEKDNLKTLGIKVFDWENTDCLEVAIVKNLPLNLLQELFELAVTIQFENDSTNTIEQYKTNLWDSVKSRYGANCPDSISLISDTSEIRYAIGQSAKKGDWFKRQDKGYKLGNLILNNFDKLEDTNYLKVLLTSLSNWIENES